MHQEIRDTISYEDFSKIDIRVGTIVSAEKVEKSNKLIKLQVDFGDEIGQRQILTGMAEWYDASDFEGMQTTFVVNLEPRKIMGEQSQGMIFALGLSDDTKPIFLKPSEVVDNGEGAR